MLLLNLIFHSSSVDTSDAQFLKILKIMLRFSLVCVKFVVNMS